MKRVTALFTALMLLVCLFAGCQKAEATSTVVLEAASAVQLTLKGNTVAETDAALDGQKLDAAIATVIGTMTQNGELTEENNTVLITVSDASLQKTALDAAAKAFDGAVICQSAEDATQGKAAFAAVVAEALGYSAADLSALDVNVLALLCQMNDVTLEGVTIAGTASEAALVGEDTALQVALAQAEVEADAASDVTVTLDFSDFLFYDVRFTANGTALEAYINAATGELLYSGVVGGDRTDDDVDEGVTEEMAIAAACISVGAEVSAVKDLECEYVDASAQIFYDVTFTYQGNKYSVLISAASGKPLEGDVAIEDTLPAYDDEASMPAEESATTEQTDAASPDAGIDEAVSSDDAGLDG